MEQAFKVIVTALGGLVGYLWGGWSTLMGILLAFVFIDYATGLLKDTFLLCKKRSFAPFCRIVFVKGGEIHG